MALPTPHGDKLRALIGNSKLPQEDKGRVNLAWDRYQDWINALRNVKHVTTDRTISDMVNLLNEHRLYMDVDLIFDSPGDFLYRQKGQLKLDNTVIEEFLPALIHTLYADMLEDSGIVIGPTTCFSGVWFESSLFATAPGGGMKLRSKDQDFALSKKVFLRASTTPDFTDEIDIETHIAFIAAECKTNLDKTMFQEAASTALDVKQAVPGAEYYLLCEWLDMTPISTSTTAIDEILILRKQKRIPSNIRKDYNTANGRQEHRDSYIQFLMDNPFSIDIITRFVDHVGKLLTDANPDSEVVLVKGYF